MANTFKNIKKKLRRKRLLAEKRHLEKAQAGAGGNEAARRKIKAALRRKKAVLKPVAAILIAVFVVLAGFLFLEKRTYRNYKVQVTSEQEDTVSTQYTYLSGKILRYSSDEVSLVNNKLETVWSQTYDMQNPVADVCGDCAVIADKDGTSMVFLDKNGITGTVSTSYSIVKAKVSKTGMAAAILDGGDHTWINFYNLDGSLVAENQTNIQDPGYPMDVALADNGVVMMVAYQFVDSSETTSYIAFYNFGEVGQNEDDRIDIRISGNGFLYNMVRIIVGSLVKVGCGFWKPEQIKEALEARDRSKAGPKAPAEGLTLISIEEETLPAVIREENEHWSYRVNQGEIESFGKAYIQIYECDECDFERLLLRLVKQASRNGAKQIHVRDNTGHLKIGYQAEYFSFDTSYNQWKLAKTTKVDSKTNGVAIQAVSLDTSDSELVEEYCNLENECFKQVPGGVKRTSKQLLLDIAEGERCFSLCKGDAQVGFFSAKKIKNEETGEEFFELESLGVSEAFRNQGIGKEGLLMFEQLAAENGYEKLSMICADSNPAIYLYERLGYQKEKMLSTWYTTRDKKRDLYEQENKQ